MYIWVSLYVFDVCSYIYVCTLMFTPKLIDILVYLLLCFYSMYLVSVYCIPSG